MNLEWIEKLLLIDLGLLYANCHNYNNFPCSVPSEYENWPTGGQLLYEWLFEIFDPTKIIEQLENY